MVGVVVTGSVNTFARTKYCGQSSQDLFIINTIRMESYQQTYQQAHHISSEDRLFMSEPPCVQPQGTFVLTVQAGQVVINHSHFFIIIIIITTHFLQVISYKVDNSKQVENLTNALIGMNMEVKINDKIDVPKLLTRKARQR